jgi:hypothetical protein
MWPFFQNNKRRDLPVLKRWCRGVHEYPPSWYLSSVNTAIMGLPWQTITEQNAMLFTALPQSFAFTLISNHIQNRQHRGRYRALELVR